MRRALQQILCIGGMFLCGLVLSSCSQQQQAPDYIPGYHYIPGKTAILKNGKAIAPKGAPSQVKRAIEAANRIAGKPYRMGGGHRRHHDNAYDCSGSTSYILKEAGLLTSTRHSRLFTHYGQAGPGKWITVYAKNGHVFLEICGLRYDTTGTGKGPRWRTDGRSTRGFLRRHPTRL